MEKAGKPEGRDDELYHLAEQELRNEDKSSPLRTPNNLYTVNRYVGNLARIQACFATIPRRSYATPGAQLTQLSNSRCSTAHGRPNRYP